MTRFPTCRLVVLLGLLVGRSASLQQSVTKSLPAETQPECKSGWQLQPQPLTSACITDTEDEVPPLDGTHKEFENMDCGLEIDVWRCLDNGVRATLIGPFNTLPGQWTSAYAKLHGLLDKDSKIVKFAGEVMGMDGRTITYPPLHMHHLHITTPGCSHYFETHGDYRINEDGSYSTAIPNGHCVVLDDGRLGMQFQVNDVQLGFDGMTSLKENVTDKVAAEPYKWFIRLSFQLVPRTTPCQPVQKFVTYWPLTKFSSDDRYSRYDVHSYDHVMWWPVYMPIAGRLILPGWIHSHRRRFKGLLLVRGQHSVHSLTGLGPDCTTTRSSDPACHDIRLARRLVLEKAGVNLVCHDEQDIPNYELISGRFYDRKGGFTCRDISFSANETFTIFAFNGVAFGNQPEDPDVTFPQHTMIFSYFVSEGNLSSSQCYVLFTDYYGWWRLSDSSTYSDALAPNINLLKTHPQILPVGVVADDGYVEHKPLILVQAGKKDLLNHVNLVAVLLLISAVALTILKRQTVNQSNLIVAKIVTTLLANLKLM